jgi:hypothetical protein
LLISTRIADISREQEAGLGKIETTHIDIGITVSPLDLENQTDHEPSLEKTLKCSK